MIPKAFTSRYKVLSGVLQNEIHIRPLGQSRSKKTFAIWDTGATGSAITKSLVRSIGLISAGFTNVTGVHGVKRVPWYAIDILLPNGITVTGISATECDELTSGKNVNKAGMLIGMDVITLGDFAVSNFNGKTTFSFRMPSMKETDYNVKSAAEQRSEYFKGSGYNPRKKRR